MGNEALKSFFWSDLEKLVTMRPEQGFKQLDVSIYLFVFSMHFISLAVEQTGS